MEAIELCKEDVMRIWWYDIHPLSRVDLCARHYPHLKYWEITPEHKEKIFEKEFGKSE